MIKNYPTFKNLVPLFFLLFSFNTFAQTQTFTTSGSIEVPAGVTQVTVEVWGGGGGGGSSWNNSSSAGGGGGGAYTIAVIDGLVPRQVVPYTVGSGGLGGWNTSGLSNPQSGVDGGATTFLTVTAKGGKGGGGVPFNVNIIGNKGLGGSAEISSGVISYNGGDGNSGFSSKGPGGGGGSSAGINGIGNDANISNGGIAPFGGGKGGYGNPTTTNPYYGADPGGGGAGGPDSNGQGTGIQGGSGGNGQIRITWSTLDFIGTVNNDYVDFGNNHSLSSNFSLEAWVLQKAIVTTGTIISKGNASSNKRGYNLFLSDGKPNLIWYDNSGSTILNMTSPYAISYGTNAKWQHIAATYDGEFAKIYIDGVLVVTSLATTTPPPTGGTEKFLLGAMYDSGTPTIPKNNFDGYIDEVRVWDVALTDQQIREMMNQEIEVNAGTGKVRGKKIPIDISGEGLTWAKLSGYYPMNDNTTNDKSGKGKNGSLKNMVTFQPQTAPLPYTTIRDGSWSDDSANTPWTYGNTVWNIPNSLGIDGETSIEWNIVETAHNITSGNKDITVLGLISTAGKLTIQDTGNIATGNAATGQELWITHYLKLNGVIDLVGESQLVQKRYGTYDADGMFITTQLSESEFDAASTGTIEIDQQGTGDSFNYNYWSSPVNSNLAAKTYSIGGVLKDGTNPTDIKGITFNGSHTWAEGDVGSIPIRLSTYWMYKLENSKGYAAWSRVGNTGEMSVGQGYTMKGSNTTLAEQNYTFVGTPNNGTIELDVNEGNEYLVGNPYPSALDADQFLFDNGPTGTNIIGTGSALHFWEHSGGSTHNLAGYQGGYATYNISGGVSAAKGGQQVAGVGTSANAKKEPGRYIAVGQAFFVVGDRAGKIRFKNNQRIFKKESTDNSIFMKSSNTKSKTDNKNLSDLRSKFRIGYDAPKISHRQLLLTVDERATKAVDWGFDAEIFEIFADDFYWMMDGKKYIIQGTNEVGLNSEVPIGIQLSKTGLVTVKIDELENVDDDTSIYLKDKLTGESFNMREKPVELNLTAGKYADRFVLIFKTQKLVAEDVEAEILIPATSQPIIEGIHVFMNNATGELQIKNNSAEEILSVTLINAVGQTIKTWNSNFNIRTISLPLSTATGVYLVQINTKTGKTVKKISVD